MKNVCFYGHIITPLFKQIYGKSLGGAPRLISSSSCRYDVKKCVHAQAERDAYIRRPGTGSETDRFAWGRIRIYDTCRRGARTVRGNPFPAQLARFGGYINIEGGLRSIPSTWHAAGRRGTSAVIAVGRRGVLPGRAASPLRSRGVPMRGRHPAEAAGPFSRSAAACSRVGNLRSSLPAEGSACCAGQLHPAGLSRPAPAEAWAAGIEKNLTVVYLRKRWSPPAVCGREQPLPRKPGGMFRQNDDFCCKRRPFLGYGRLETRLFGETAQFTSAQAALFLQGISENDHFTHRRVKYSTITGFFQEITGKTQKVKISRRGRAALSACDYTAPGDGCQAFPLRYFPQDLQPVSGRYRLSARQVSRSTSAGRMMRRTSSSRSGWSMASTSRSTAPAASRGLRWSIVESMIFGSPA